jgi:hypothetical protein
MTCILHPYRDEAEVWCVHMRRPIRGFCGECVGLGEHEVNFGRCYRCDAGEHEGCVGVPCQCECPASEFDLLAVEISLTERHLNMLWERRAATVRAAGRPVAAREQSR